MFYQIFIKPLFFLFNPERAHYLAADLIRFTLRIPGMSLLFKAIPVLCALKDFVPSKDNNSACKIILLHH